MLRTFQNVGRMESFKLENQNGALFSFNDADIEFLIDDMLEDPDQFVILTAPAAVNKVRYVQASTCDKGIVVQLGIEEERTHLIEKICSEGECKALFLRFFKGSFEPDFSEYKPVEF